MDESMTAGSTQTDGVVRVHGTCIEICGVGVLLRGPSGSGKSDLALRLVDGGGHLIADDYTELSVKDGILTASAPPTIAGLMEVRGVGILRLPAAATARLDLVADLVAPEKVARLPEPDRCAFLGVAVRRIDIAPFEASAPAKLRAAVASATLAPDQAIAQE